MDMRSPAFAARLRDPVAGSIGNGRHGDDRPPQWRQSDTMLAVVDQRPLPGAIVTEPVVFDLALLLAGANERR